MMQHAVDPWSFASPPLPGFSRPRRALPPSPRKLPVQPKLPKREALPVSRAAAQKDHSIKRQRLCSDYEHDIDANLRATEKNAEERLRPDYLKTVQQDQVSASARASLVGWMDAFVGATASLMACRLPRPHLVGAGHEHAQRLRALPPGRQGRLRRCQVRGPAHRAGARRPQDRQLRRVRHGQGGARHGAPHSGSARVPARRPHDAHVRRPLHEARRGGGGTQDPAHGASPRRPVAAQLHLRWLPAVRRGGVRHLPSKVWAQLNPPDVLPWSTGMQYLTGYNVLDLAACVTTMYYCSQSIICNAGC